MQTVWFPIPVAALFRRIVNVVSTLSISHHYLHQPPADPDIRPTYPQRWSAWLASSFNSRSLSFSTAIPLEALDAYLEVTAEGIEDKVPPCNDGSERPRSHSLTPDQIHQLINNPVLYDPLRKPRYPIVLCHGLYGFDVRGPSAFPILQQHYWSNVLGVLRKKVGAEVLVTGVPSTGSVSSRAENLDRLLTDKAFGRGVNFLAHSMGGLDCRHLISHIKPSDYVPLSLTTIATPHRGSPFMDWCKQYLGLGRYKDNAIRTSHTDNQLESQGEPLSRESNQGSSMKSLLSIAALPSSFTTLLLSMLDSPAYANLTSTYLNTVFNPHTPNDPSVKYFSVAGRTSSMSIWHPLWLPKMVLDGFEERERARLREVGHPVADMETAWGNDGLVTVQSARWGEFLGVMEGCDHWEIRGARGLDVDLSIPGPNEWNLTDWGKFVRAWKREEKAAAREAGAGISEQAHAAALASAGASLDDGERGRDPRQRHDRDSMNADEVVKSSTDKLSAVFDWIVDQVPATRSLNGLTSPSSSRRQVGAQQDEHQRAREKSPKPTERNDLATKMDLERFYIALCKKLYDEGL